MSPRKTIALSALFFAGLAALWWADYARIPTSKDRQRRSGRVLPGLLDVKPEEVARVEIDSGEARLAFERRGDRWWMTRPHETLADRSRLNALVVNLKGLPASVEG